MNTRINIVKRFYYKVSLYILSIIFLALSGCRWKNQNTETESVNSEPVTPDSKTLAATDTSSIFKVSIAGKQTDTIKAVIKKKNSSKIFEPICEYGVVPVDYKIINDPDDNPIVKDSTVIKHKKPDPMTPVVAYGTFPDYSLDTTKNK